MLESVSPKELLAMLVQIEGQRFADTFREATEELRTTVDYANDEIRSGTESLALQLGHAVDDIAMHVGEAVGSHMDQSERDNDAIEYEILLLKAGMEALLKNQGLDDLMTIYSRPRIYHVIEYFRKRMLEATATTIYKEVCKICQSCDHDLLLKLCREMLGDIRIPKTRTKRTR